MSSQDPSEYSSEEYVGWDGELWQDGDAVGPAVDAPDWVKEIILEPALYIEFLAVPDDDSDLKKNHIVSSVRFADQDGIEFESKVYYSAQISMELSDKLESIPGKEGTVSSLHLILLYLDLNSNSTSLENNMPTEHSQSSYANFENSRHVASLCANSP
jgi:hypothetical protein